MGMLARLGVVLGLDSAEFQKGIADANRKLDNISAQMPKFAAVAGAAFIAATYKALQYADAVADTAKANDMAVSSILALGTALQQNGGDAQMAGRLLSSFTAQVDEAAEGSLGAQKAFAKVGISLNDLAKLDATALFDKTVIALSKIEDPMTRNALAMQMFGKAAKGVDWVGMADNVEGNREAYEKYARSIEIAAELNDKLEASTKSFTLAFTEAALPALNELFDALTKDAGAMKFFMDIVRTTTEVVAVLVKYTTTVVRVLIEDFKFLGTIIGRVFKFEFAEMADDYKAYKEKVEAMVKSDKDFANRVLNREADKRDASKPKGVAGRLVTPAKDPEAEKAKKLAESLEKAKGITGEFEKQQQLNLEQAALRAQLNGLATKEREVAEAVLRVKEQTASQLKDIDLKIIDATIEKNNEMVDVLRKVRDEVEASGKSFEEKTAKQTVDIQNVQNTFAFGWNKAFRQYAEDSENYMKKGEAMFNAVTNNMNNAIDNFVETGKFSFRDFTASIIKDLIKIEMKMQAMQLFRMGLSYFGLSGATPTAGGKASGGQVGSGLPYMVGEQGPELFIPNSAGTIIPNNRLSETLTGGSGQVVNYNGPYIANLSAIDTQSATQFLAKNKMAVWSANQSAGRSIPQSR
jgi:hypothetical protein